MATAGTNDAGLRMKSTREDKLGTVLREARKRREFGSSGVILVSGDNFENMKEFRKQF